MILKHILQEMVVEMTTDSESVSDARAQLDKLRRTVDNYMEKVISENKFPGNFDMLVNVQNQVVEMINSEKLKLKENTQ